MDRIQIAMGDIPPELHSQEDKVKAKQILDEVQEYANTLVQLIHRPDFRTCLKRLESASDEGARLQAHEIEELIKDLEHVLYVLDMYLKDLNNVIENDTERWKKKAKLLVLMIDQKFGGEKGELRKEFQTAVHTENELRELVTSEKHLEAFLR